MFYANHGIGWVARPKHDDSSPSGFKRAGRFKKASNMNYALALSLKAEKHLAELLAREKNVRGSVAASSALGAHGVNEEMRYGMQYQNHDGEDQGVVNTGLGQRVRAASSDAGSQSVDEWEDIDDM